MISISPPKIGLIRREFWRFNYFSRQVPFFSKQERCNGKIYYLSSVSFFSVNDRNLFAPEILYLGSQPEGDNAQDKTCQKIYHVVMTQVNCCQKQSQAKGEKCPEEPAQVFESEKKGKNGNGGMKGGESTPAGRWEDVYEFHGSIQQRTMNGAGEFRQKRIPGRCSREEDITEITQIETKDHRDQGVTEFFVSFL